MIRLERPYVLMTRTVAVELLATVCVDGRRLGLEALHAQLRLHCPLAWHLILDRLIVVEDRHLPILNRRFQDEVSLMDHPPARGRAGQVVPRSVALWLHPELADRPNACVQEVLRRTGEESAVVVDDVEVVEATIAFNRYLRDRIPHGLSPRPLTH